MFKFETVILKQSMAIKDFLHDYSCLVLLNGALQYLVGSMKKNEEPNPLAM